MRTLINPLSLPYPYLHQNGEASRRASSPALVCFRGIYYLFTSWCGGFYYSYDLVDWKYHRNLELGLYQPDPSAITVDGRLLLCHTPAGGTLTIYITTDPRSDDWQTVRFSCSLRSPFLFQDQDGSLYLYGLQEDRMTCQRLDISSLLPLGEPVSLFMSQIKSLSQKLLHRSQPALKARPLLYRHNDRYFLISPSGTLCVSLFPDGPFEPFSEPAGLTGAGGSLMNDIYGNLWQAAETPDHRIALLPALLDEEGRLYSLPSFMDQPYEIPEGYLDPKALQPKYRLLSRYAKTSASSSKPGHEPDLAVRENAACWCAEESEGAWLEVDLGSVQPVLACQIRLADLHIPAKEVAEGVSVNGLYIDLDIKQRVRYVLEASTDGLSWTLLKDLSKAATTLSDAFLELEEPASARYLRLTAVELPYKAPLAVSHFRVFG